MDEAVYPTFYREVTSSASSARAFFRNQGECPSMRPLVCVASTVLLSLSTASAQVRETVNVNYVEVPVTVLTRGGEPVRGLTRDRFEIVDEGKVRTISSFETIDFGSPQSLKSTS